MFGRRNHTSLGKVAAAAAVLKLMPMRRTLMGIAAVAGAVYAIRRMRGRSQSQSMGTRSY